MATDRANLRLSNGATLVVELKGEGIHVALLAMNGNVPTFLTPRIRVEDEDVEHLCILSQYSRQIVLSHPKLDGSLVLWGMDNNLYVRMQQGWPVKIQGHCRQMDFRSAIRRLTAPNENQ